MNGVLDHDVYYTSEVRSAQAAARTTLSAMLSAKCRRRREGPPSLVCAAPQVMRQSNIGYKQYGGKGRGNHRPDHQSVRRSILVGSGLQRSVSAVMVT